jgi:hypothetical protein
MLVFTLIWSFIFIMFETVMMISSTSVHAFLFHCMFFLLQVCVFLFAYLTMFKNGCSYDKTFKDIKSFVKLIFK